MKQTLVILFSIFIYSCDNIVCSSEKLSESGESFLLELNDKYSNFDIYSDECYPLGYYNARSKDEIKIDTLALKSLLNLSLEHKSLPDRIQVFGINNDFRFILYKVGNQHMILLPSDL